MKTTIGRPRQLSKSKSQNDSHKKNEAHKVFQKTIIFYPLICPVYPYQGSKIVIQKVLFSFS